MQLPALRQLAPEDIGCVPGSVALSARLRFLALQSGVEPRFFVDLSTGQPHIYGHNVTEAEVEDVLTRPIEDRPGSEGSRVALGQTEAGDI